MSHSHAAILVNATTFIHIPYTYGNFLDAFHLYQDIIKSMHYSQHDNKELSFQISSNVMLYNNISHLPITCILVVNYKYSTIHFLNIETYNVHIFEHLNIQEMIIQILIFVCLVDSILVFVFLNYWSLCQMCSPSSFDFEDSFLSFS